MQTRHVEILLFDQVEVLDFAGPFEVFSTATRVARRQGLSEPFRVNTISLGKTKITARAGLQVLAGRDIATASPAPDVLVIPGGVVNAEMTNAPLIDWLGKTAAQVELVASVCTGAFLLAQAGVLDAQTPDCTTHWEDIADLRLAFPALCVHDERPYVDTGHVVSSAGISAGIDMSLYLVARLASPELAAATARQMEYRWTVA